MPIGTWKKEEQRDKPQTADRGCDIFLPMICRTRGCTRSNSSSVEGKFGELQHIVGHTAKKGLIPIEHSSDHTVRWPNTAEHAL